MVVDKTKIIKALTSGLLAGYGGQTQFEKLNRGTFEVSSSHYQQGDVVYHDEWTKGGGQELVRSGDKQYTRVYAGGAIGDTKTIIQKLIFFIQQLQDKTRLFSDCDTSDGGWKYSYKIIDMDPTLDITVGKEVITYHDEIMFVHVFVLSPIT